MFSHSNTARFFCVLIAALIYSLSLAGVASAQTGNTSLGTGALVNNTIDNTAIGLNALHNNSTGNLNTASGFEALTINTTATKTPPSGPLPMCLLEICLTQRLLVMEPSSMPAIKSA